MSGAEALLAAGWGVACGLLVALGVALWVLNAVLGLLRRQGRMPPGGAELQIIEPNQRRA